jgi:hypothetical protein
MAEPIKPQAVPLTDEDLRKAVLVNEDLIQQEYVNFPSTLRRWVKRRVDAAKLHRLAELDDEIQEEKLRLEIRGQNEAAIDGFAKDGAKVKKLTVDEVNAMVVTDPRYRASKEKVIAAAHFRDDSVGAVDVLQAKKDMLVSLGASMRADQESGISIKDRQRR